MSVLLALCMCITCTPSAWRDQRKSRGSSRIGLSYEYMLNILLNFVCSLNDAYETYLVDKV